jgi:hypothetical protein
MTRVLADIPAGSYAAGATAVSAVVVSLTWGSRVLRAALLPAWYGAAARLAEAVVGLAALFFVLQVLGSVGAFRRVPVFAALVAAGGALGIAGKVLKPAGPAPPRHVPAPGGRGVRLDVVVAAAAAALLSAQWAAHVGFAFDGGMNHPDTLIYHMPNPVRWVQDGAFTRIPDGGVQPYYPYDAELLHALGVLAFRRDFLSPLVNLGWAALTGVAAWCLGRVRGVAPLSLLGAIAVLGLPALTGTQPGQASNDVAVVALLLTTVALLVVADGDPRGVAVAALAGGLALATKFTVVVPVALVTVGLVVYALRRGRAKLVVVWAGGLLATGSYWFLRNWVLHGNPLPWVGIDVGPFELAAETSASGRSVVAYADEAEVWRKWYLPGLARSLGRIWPLVLALGLAAMVVVAARARNAFARIGAVAALGGMVYYPFSPLSADGHGIAFEYTLRYVTPSLIVGFVLLPTVFAGARARHGVMAGFAAIVVANAFAANHERVPAWPSGQVLTAIVVGVAVCALPVVLSRVPRSAAFVVAIVSALGIFAAVGGRFLERHYTAHRYRDVEGPAGPLYAAFHDVTGARIAQFGRFEIYPLFGNDLSNRVARVGLALPDDPTTCDLRARLAEGDYDYVAIEPGIPGFFASYIPPPGWLLNDPALAPGDVDGLVYRRVGSFDLRSCEPAIAASRARGG